MAGTITETTESRIARDVPTIRAPIAYIMSRFPTVTETFILREMLELERQGQPVVIFPLLRVEEPVRHDEVIRLMPRVHYTPFLSLPILLANWHYFLRSPRKYLECAYEALKGTWGSGNLFLGAIGIFPKSVYIARRVEEQGIKHVHAHFATHPAHAALIISELAGIDFSFTAHAHDIFVHTKMLDKKIEKARFIVTISEFNKRYLLKLSPQTPASKIKVVRCGVELDRYTIGHERLTANIPDRQTRDPFTILCVASLKLYKGHDYLIRACHLLRGRIPNFRCLIVGEGKERKTLERLITNLEMQDFVQLLGARPMQEVTALMAESDVFVLPSVVAPDGQMEGIPVALMEAMMSGLPVVASNLSGIPELVEHRITGLLVPSGAEQPLADSISLLYHQPKLGREIASMGRAKVERDYDLRKNVEALHSLFREVHESCADEKMAPRAWSASESNEIVTRQIGKKVLEKASEYFPDLDGLDCHIQTRAVARSAPGDSECHELILCPKGGTPRRMILKLHRPRHADLPQMLEEARLIAEREYHTLMFLWNALKPVSSHLTVPRPMDCFPETAALLLEKCEGQKLETRLRWGRLAMSQHALQELYHQIEACGEWLALFQEITNRNEISSDICQRIEREFVSNLKKSVELGFPQELAFRLSQWFERSKELFLSPDQPVVARHCDFAPYNIFLTRDKISVIDLEGFQPGIAYEDLCYFGCMVESMPFYHLSSEIIRQIKDSFLTGYRRKRSVDSDSISKFSIITMVNIMANVPVLRRQAGWHDRWKRRQRLAFYTHWFKERI